MVLYDGCGRVVRDDLVDTGDVEGGIVVDEIRGAVVGIGLGAGAGVVAVGPGERAELSVLETPARSDDARFWLFENLSRDGEECERLRGVPGGRTYVWPF
jgi:hypothetical protein